MAMTALEKAQKAELRRIKRELDDLCVNAIAVSMDEPVKAAMRLSKEMPYALNRVYPKESILNRRK